MTHVITVPDTPDGITVELWGAQFTPRPATKSLANQAEPIAAKIHESADYDELIDAIGAVLDLKLANADRGRLAPSVLVKRRWDADEVSVPQLLALLNQIRVAEFPT